MDISEADKHPEMKEFYFGGLTRDRVAFSIGRDIVLEPRQSGPPLNYFIYPYVEVDGQPIAKDALKPRFEFHDIPTSDIRIEDVVGNWHLQVIEENGEVHDTVLAIDDKGGKLTAVFSGAEIGDCPASNLKFDEDKFSFTVRGQLAGSDFAADCVTKPQRDRITGGIVLRIAGDDTELSFSGERSNRRAAKVSATKEKNSPVES